MPNIWYSKGFYKVASDETESEIFDQKKNKRINKSQPKAIVRFFLRILP